MIPLSDWVTPESGHMFLEYLCGVRQAPELSMPGPQVAGKPGFLRVGGLGKVLILAREEIVAALLGLMVELQGLEPLYLAKAEIAEDMIRRELPKVVVIDCDHQDCTDLLLAAVRDAGTKPVLFSPFRFAGEVKRVASRHGVEYFTLPTEPEAFARIVMTAG